VTALTVSAQAFFEPARTATIPNVTSSEELLPANALARATWSAMLAIGASVGGLVTAVFGRNVAFVINASVVFRVVPVHRRHALRREAAPRPPVRGVAR